MSPINGGNRKETEWQRWNQTKWPENRPTTGLGVRRGLEWATKQAKVSSSPGRSTTWASYATMIDTSCIILTSLAPGSEEEQRMYQKKVRRRRRESSSGWKGDECSWQVFLLCESEGDWLHVRVLHESGHTHWEEEEEEGPREGEGSTTHLFVSLPLCNARSVWQRTMGLPFLPFHGVSSRSLSLPLSLSYAVSFSISLEVLSVSCCW